MGTHPIFESDFDCLTVSRMLSRLCTRAPTRILSTTSLAQAKVKPIGSKEGVKSAQQQVDDWYSTNAKTSRPMSPHLSVYSWTIPMTFSACNRIFSFALTMAFIALPLLVVFTGMQEPALDIREFAENMRQTTLGTFFIYAFKAALAFPFFFHTFVGFRHWSWDILALGIRDMGTFYMTGYVALAAALVFTAFVLICKPDGYGF